jgi:hypothetical protein
MSHMTCDCRVPMMSRVDSAFIHSFIHSSNTHSDIFFAIFQGKMRTRQCQSKHLDNLFLRHPDFSGALIQGAMFALNHQSSAYFVQALENHSTVKHIHTRHSRTRNSLDETSFLRYLSSFMVPKAGQRPSHQFLGVALLISRKLRKKYYRTLTGLRASHTTVHYPPCANSDSGIITSHADRTASQQTLSESPATTAPYRPAARREDVRTPFSRRSTPCSPPIASIPKLGLVSPIYLPTLNSIQDPPLTPINQIFSTPQHPPRIGNKGPRTPCGPVLLDRECDFTRVSLANTCSLGETPHHVYQPNRRLSFRNRLWVRRPSYSHFKTSTVSHLLSSPLKMPDITNASSANHQLASPLNVRSSTSTPCAPQTVEDGGPSHLQWSPHCLRCFA